MDKAMDRKDETMNLDDLRDLLSDVPDTDEFDLDSIIAEVEGGASAAPRETPRYEAPEPQPRYEAPEPAPQPAEKPRTAPKTRPVRQEEHERFPDPAVFEDEEDEEDYDPRAARIAAREA